MSSPISLWGVLSILSLSVACNRAVAPEAPTWMESTVVEQVNTLGPHERVGPLHRGATYEEDDSLVVQVKLELGRCYTLSAVADTTVEELRVFVFSPSGGRLLRKTAPNKLMASLCVTGELQPGAFGIPVSMHPGLYDIELKTAEGNGHVMLGVFLSEDIAPMGGAPNDDDHEVEDDDDDDEVDI